MTAQIRLWDGATQWSDPTLFPADTPDCCYCGLAVGGDLAGVAASGHPICADCWDAGLDGWPPVCGSACAGKPAWSTGPGR